jgi:O-antigen/teichoic acid export membrane protein
MKLGHELKRLGRHSAIYGLGGLVSRILATILLPLYTHYLPPGSFGRVEVVTAATTVGAIVLQMGISSAFFRFYFDAKEDAARLTVIRTSFWFTMAVSSIGLVLGLLFAGSITHVIGLGHHTSLVQAGAVGLWAQTNYNQVTALFRVEERSLQFAIASIANVLITVCAMVLAIAVFHWGAVGLIVGNFTGTLVVYLALLAYRTEQLGLEFDRNLFRGMQRFGMPLVPSALALWAINFIDREFVIWYKGAAENGVYSVAVKIAGVITFVMAAFRTAWPAFAYSIDDDRDAKRTYSYVLTYLLTFASWISLALGALAPWIVELLTNPRYQRAEKGVALLAFAGVVYAGYTVLAIGSGRARKTQFNWVVTGIGAAANVGLNFWLIPKYGMVGAAISTAAAYVVLFVGMTVYAQSVYRVDYQWRRVVTALGAAVGLTVAARAA